MSRHKHKHKKAAEHGQAHGHKHDLHRKSEPTGNPHRQAPRKGIHKDWRAWVVVLLMLAAMAAYVMSLDESLRPFGSPEPRTPAAEPAAGE